MPDAWLMTSTPSFINVYVVAPLLEVKQVKVTSVPLSRVEAGGLAVKVGVWGTTVNNIMINNTTRNLPVLRTCRTVLEGVGDRAPPRCVQARCAQNSH